MLDKLLSEIQQNLVTLNNFRTAVESVLTIGQDQMTIGFPNAYITLYKNGNVQVTGYSQVRKKIVTVSLDEIINNSYV